MSPELSIQLPVGDIPDPKDMIGWKDIPIRESGQQLVDLNSYTNDFPITLFPQYHLQGMPNSSDKMYLRLEAVERLAQASRLLPRDYKLVVFDAHRPIAVQQSLFDSYMSTLHTARPDLLEEELIEMTQRFVSLPSIDPYKPFPHSTGGGN